MAEANQVAHEYYGLEAGHWSDDEVVDQLVTYLRNDQKPRKARLSGFIHH